MKDLVFGVCENIKMLVGNNGNFTDDDDVAVISELTVFNSRKE